MARISSILLVLVVIFFVYSGISVFYGGFVQNLGADPSGQLELSARSNQTLAIVQNATNTFQDLKADVGTLAIFGGIKGLFTFITIPLQILAGIPSFIHDVLAVQLLGELGLAWAQPFLIAVLSLVVVFAIFSAIAGRDS